MRPPSFTLTVRALCALPRRLCNPPPAAGNVRSCKVTPLIKLTLDDVLNKRHLPPLTLKDFEEWLVFVERAPQYLYFILWLREYESRYAAWLAESGCESPCAPSFDPSRDLSYVNLIPSSPALALFFTRAKQTFLDPASPYALGPAALLALAPSTHSLAPSIPHFSVPGDDVGALPPALASQPHPHPRELAPLAAYARSHLKDSLSRFAETACQNVGTRRAWCGVAGGTFLALAFGLAPALAALLCAPSRWWRAVGWLGCWLGGTVVVSSFHGICMMIYVFGDLRQLRSFELARPSISGPRPIARARPRLRSLFTLTRDEESPPPPPPLSPHQQKDTLSWSVASHTSTGTPVVCLAPYSFRVGEHTASASATATTDSGATDAAAALALEEDDYGIEISPAYYHDPVPDAADAKSVRRESLRSGESRLGLVMKWVLGRRPSTAGEAESGHAGTFGVRSGGGALGSLPARAESVEDDLPTAAFITHDYLAPAPAPAPVPAPAPAAAPVQFDFDKLPGAAGLYAHPGACLPTPPPSPALVVAGAGAAEKGREWWDTCPRHPAVEATVGAVRARGTWRARLRRVTGVPAFGPVTRVLEPVVARGQWEIVVRSAVAAALGAWVVVGCLVALPARA